MTRFSALTSTFLHNRCWRLLLVLSLWNGPLPWMHWHSFAEADLIRDVSLARHVDQFHRPVSRSAVVVPGWHLHLILPGDAGLNDEHDQGAPGKHSAPGTQYAPSTQATTDVAVQGYLQEQFCPADDLAIMTNSLPQEVSRAPSSFFATFAPSVSICDLIERQLC